MLRPVLVDRFPIEVVCFQSQVFSYLMAQELARAERYGYFVSLLLIRFQARDHAAALQLGAEIAKILRTLIRKTDFLGMPDLQTFSVLLLNSKVENAQKVLARLALEISIQISDRSRLLKLEASATVFPTDANSQESLWRMGVENLSKSDGGGL